MDENIKKLIDELLKNTITPQQLDSFLTTIAKLVKERNDNFEKLTEKNSKEYVETVQNAIAYIEEKHTSLSKDLEDKGGKSIAEIKKELTNVKKLLDEARSFVEDLKNTDFHGNDGNDGRDADEELIVERVLEKIQLPEYEETILDTGYEIVDKINELPTDKDEYKIDWEHLKNIPDFTNGRTWNGGGGRNLYQLLDVNLAGLTNGETLVWNSTTNIWEAGTPGGVGTQTLAQTLVLGNVTGGTNIALSYDVFNGVTNRITADQVNGIGTYPTISIQGGGYTAAGIYIDPVGTANPNVSSGLYSYFSSADGYFHTINVQASTGLDAAQQVTIGGASTADGLLQFSNASNGFYLRFKPGATANNITYILPITDPTAGQVLSASAPIAGVSTLSWAANGGTPALTATQVAYGSAGNTMTSSANLIFDNANTQLSITGNGTAALPALSVGGTTNGIWLATTNTLGFSTAGVNRMTLDSVSLSSQTNGGFLLARAAGSATDPTYSFKNDSNTGFYSNVADTIKATFGGTQYATWDARGLFIGGTTTPTAKIHLGAETASASTGPIKFTAPGALLTAPEALVLGPSVAGDDLHFTITTGAARKRLLMADPVGGLTSTRVPFATTNGRLTDSANMTFVTDTLFVEKLKVGTGSVTLDAINHGSYAPTATGVTNVGSVSATSSGWYRIGRKVHVYGIFSVDPDAAGTITQFTLDLPIASDLTNAYDLSGGATNSEDSETAARIYADTASDLALVEFRPKAMTTSYDWSFWFDYEII